MVLIKSGYFVLDLWRTALIFCRLVDLQRQTREPTSESIPTNCEPLRTLLIVSLVLVVGFPTTLVVIFILRRKAYRRQNKGE